TTFTRSHIVKRLAAVLVFLVACSSAAQQQPSTGVSTNVVGADSPRQAVQQFLAAAHAQDLKAMALIWGTNDGPARDVVDHSQLEKRELIMECYVTHDSYAVMSEVSGEKGSRVQVHRREGTWRSLVHPGRRAAAAQGSLRRLVMAAGGNAAARSPV